MKGTLRMNAKELCTLATDDGMRSFASAVCEAADGFIGQPEVHETVNVSDGTTDLRVEFEVVNDDTVEAGGR